MRSVSIVLGILFLIACARAPAGEPTPPPPAPGEGEAKPKTEEEILGEKIAEALAPLKTAAELSPEDQDKAFDKSEADLLALGPKAVPLLEAMLPKRDEKGKIVFSEKLKEILGREDLNVVGMAERVMRAHGWVSEADRTKRESLLKELRDPDIQAEDLSTGFVEIGLYGVEGLREEHAKAAADPKRREKILNVLQLMAKQGCHETAVFLLDLCADKDAAARAKAAQGLASLAETEDEKAFKTLDQLFQKEEAYPMLVGMLRLDGDPDVRRCAALVLGMMEVKEAAQELVNALDDPKEKVKDEAAHALTLIERNVPIPSDPEKRIKALKSWWGQSGASFPPQIKAAPPVRKPKAPGKGEAPGGDGGGTGKPK
ncbi:MAG: HEAT repeat domain-containing protein [Planctomycetes bacterium]|nr:HEAT repeat domain-containing protein [Planctomycetota bacterium]